MSLTEIALGYTQLGPLPTFETWTQIRQHLCTSQLVVVWQERLKSEWHHSWNKYNQHWVLLVLTSQSLENTQKSKVFCIYEGQSTGLWRVDLVQCNKSCQKYKFRAVRHGRQASIVCWVLYLKSSHAEGGIQQNTYPGIYWQLASSNPHPRYAN